MATFSDTPIYEAGIYQLETSDIIAGGAEGISNLPMQQLANRTRKLRDLLETEHDATGAHSGPVLRAHLVGALGDPDVGSGAAIEEAKLSLTSTGETRPYAFGTYTTLGQLADDALYTSLHSILDTVTIDSILTPVMNSHATSGAIHPAIQAVMASIQTQLYTIYKQMIAQAVLADIHIQDYPKGYLVDFASSGDIIGGLSSGYTFDAPTQSFMQSLGSTRTLTVAASSAFQENIAGSVTQFVVDTVNAAGHFNVACPAQVKVGCRITIAGADYPITAISTSGVSANTVTFAGTLPLGTYAVTGIYGTKVAAGTNVASLSSTAGNVYPVTSRYTVLCPVDSSNLRTILSSTKTESLNGGAIYYSVSFGPGGTYQTWNGTAWSPVARNNAGTWQYWTGSAWAAAYSNSAPAAISDAMGVTANRNAGTVFEGLSSANWPVTWGATAYVAITLTSVSPSATPTFTSLVCSVRDKVPGLTAVVPAPTGYLGAPSPVSAWCVLAGTATTPFSVNSNILLYVSKDAGTTWSLATIDSATQILPGRWILSGPAPFPAGTGTTLRLKVVTTVGVEFNLDSAGMFVA